MAKERESDTIRTLDAMFKKLMAMEDYAPPAPANSDVVDVMLGNKQQKWAFERTPDGSPGPYGDPWKEGVNITPFGQRDDKFKENIKKELVTMFSHGAGYDQAAAQMAHAIAAQQQAATGADAQKLKKGLFDILEEERKKRQTAETAPTSTPTNPAPTAIPQGFFTGQGGGVTVATPPPRTAPSVSGVLTYPPTKKTKKPAGVINDDVRKRFPELFD